MSGHGRLTAHNQRFKELCRKKLERRENKIWSNRLKNTHNEGKAEIELKRIDPKKLKKITRNTKESKSRTKKRILYSNFIILIILRFSLFFNS